MIPCFRTESREYESTIKSEKAVTPLECSSGGLARLEARLSLAATPIYRSLGPVSDSLYLRTP